LVAGSNPARGANSRPSRPFHLSDIKNAFDRARDPSIIHAASAAPCFYVLPRAVIVLLGWGTMYFVLTALSPSLAPAIVYLAGISWLAAGIVCFGCLYRLRRDGPLRLERAAAMRQNTS
jgi:hypothetical protein